MGERVRRGLVARYGVEVGSEAAAEAMRVAWERWPELLDMSNPAGFLFRVGQSHARPHLRWWRRRVRMLEPTDAAGPPGHGRRPRAGPCARAVGATFSERSCCWCGPTATPTPRPPRLLDITEAAVTNHVRRGTQRVRKFLEETEMTVSEHDLDERLQAFGDELDRRSRTHPPAQQPDSESRSRVPLLLAGVLVAFAVGGLAVFAITRHRPPEPSVPAATPELAPDVQGGDARTLAASTACLRSLERFVDSDMPAMPAEVAASLEWPAVDSAKIIAFDIPGELSLVRILIVDANAGYICKTDRQAPAEATVHGDLVDNALGPFPAGPDRDQIDVVSSIGSSPQLGVGPGTTLYVGRVGADVSTVEAVLPNGGPPARCHLRDGWFVIDVDVPDGVELFYNDQIAWTSLTGDERTERVDLLDEQSAAGTLCSRSWLRRTPSRRARSRGNDESQSSPDPLRQAGHRRGTTGASGGVHRMPCRRRRRREDHTERSRPRHHPGRDD